MKASELIERLKQRIEEVGNIDVLCRNFEGDAYSVKELFVVWTGPEHDRKKSILVD